MPLCAADRVVAAVYGAAVLARRTRPVDGVAEANWRGGEAAGGEVESQPPPAAATGIAGGASERSSLKRLVLNSGPVDVSHFGQAGFQVDAWLGVGRSETSGGEESGGVWF